MRTYPNMNELLAAIEEKLDVNTTAETVQKDIAVMKKMPPDGFDAPIKFNRTHLGYEYTNPDFSIYGVSLNSYDVDSINEAIDVISSIGGSRVSEKFTHAIEKVLSNVQELNNTEENEESFKPIIFRRAGVLSISIYCTRLVGIGYLLVLSITPIVDVNLKH